MARLRRSGGPAGGGGLLLAGQRVFGAGVVALIGLKTPLLALDGWAMRFSVAVLTHRGHKIVAD
jgi:hypothetical protein